MVELQREICQIGLQIVYFRLSAGMMQVVCRLFVVRDPCLDFSSISMLFPLEFRGSRKTRNLRTYCLTDQPMDGRTDPHIEMRGRI